MFDITFLGSTLHLANVHLMHEYNNQILVHY